MPNPTPEESAAQPKTISMTAKCSDMFAAALLSETGKVLAEYDGYVPAFFPEVHYGDYIKFEIDLATGRILNWDAPTMEDLAIFKPASAEPSE